MSKLEPDTRDRLVPWAWKLSMRQNPKEGFLSPEPLQAFLTSSQVMPTCWFLHCMFWAMLGSENIRRKEK